MPSPPRAGTRGADRVPQPASRRANLSRVLGHLRRHGPGSRTALATATGLPRSTVSALVDELISRRLVRETHSGAGRSARAFALDGAGIGALGVEINVDHLSVHGTDLSGQPLIERRIGYDTPRAGPDRAVATLVQVVRDASRQLAQLGAPVAGVAVAVPGLIDTRTGVVVLAPNLGWRGLPLAARLAAALPTGPWLLVENDANLAALAEYDHGVVAGTPDLVYLAGAPGVGAGIIAGGHLWRGADGFAGELGHLPVDPDGRRCGCGRVGCWETRVGLAELVRRVTPQQRYGQAGSRVPDPQERLAEVYRRLAAGDPVAQAAIIELGRWLGVGAAILVNLVNPRVIVLGGHFAALADRVIPAARAELTRLALAPSVAVCRLVASDLGFTAAVQGAAGLVVDQVIDDPTRLGRAAPGRQR